MNIASFDISEKKAINIKKAALVLESKNAIIGLATYKDDDLKVIRSGS